LPTQSQVFISLVLLSTLEVLAQTFLQAYWSKDASAVIYAVSGLLIGILPLLETRPGANASVEMRGKTALHYLLLVFLSLFISYFGWQAIRQQPLDYTFADMLPIIQIMGERWLDGSAVYAIIPEIWDGMQPIYLPMMWIPYTLPIAAGLDIRVINLVFIAMAVFLALGAKPKKSWLAYLILLPVVLVLAYILVDYSTLLTISEEPVVVGFYALLGYFLVKNKPLGIAAALTCCLLSRYTLIFWAVTHIAYTFIRGERKTAITIGGFALILGLLIMFASQGWHQLELFYSLRSSYQETLANPAEEWGVTNTINGNIGLARFVGYEHLTELYRLLFWGTLLLPLLLYLWYHFKGKGSVHLGLFALCSLKLCLVFFFNVNPMPYSYLFYTSTFLSLVLIGQYKPYGNELSWRGNGPR
jgi:hypothetical protein